jgi:hypothetical protein
MWLAFLTGLLLGTLLTLFGIAHVVAKSDKKRVQNGVMEIGGVVYRIVRLDP